MHNPSSRHPLILKMPNLIANFLKINDADVYTVHCFGRSFASLVANGCAYLPTLKRNGGWNLRHRSIRKQNKIVVGNKIGGTEKKQIIQSPDRHRDFQFLVISLMLIIVYLILQINKSWLLWFFVLSHR